MLSNAMATVATFGSHNKCQDSFLWVFFILVLWLAMDIVLLALFTIVLETVIFMGRVFGSLFIFV